MRKLFILVIMVGVTIVCRAQELFISTEPASNMPARSFGVRLGSENRIENGAFTTRIEPEFMYGVSAPLMLHAQAHLSNATGAFVFETAGLYAKYRLFSDDGFKYHIRTALYCKALFGKQHTTNPLDVLGGRSPNIGGGVIATMLLNRLALSTTIGVNGAIPDISGNGGDSYHRISAVNYSLSGGYLIYPDKYESYDDPNVNLYCEILGTRMNYNQMFDGATMSASASELVITVGPQVILSSVARIDLAFKTTLFTSLPIQRQNAVLLRFERNFF